MNILITGVNGHIGSQLAASLLNTGHKIFGLDIKDDNIQYLHRNKNFIFQNFDITKAGALPGNLLEAEILIHCAALVHKSSKDLSRANYFRVNHEGTKNILFGLRKSRLNHIIFLSTVSVYGNLAQNSIPDENTDCRPEDFYGESKVEAEKEIQLFSEHHSIPYTIFRLAPVYGINFLLNVHKRIHLPVKLAFYKIGSGKQRVSLCSILNMTQTIEGCLVNKKSYNEIFILKDPVDYSINDIIHTLREVYSKKIKLIVPIPAWLPKLIFGSVGLFFPKKGRLLLSQFRKIEKDYCFSGNKIRSAGYPLDWDLKHTLATSFKESG